MSRIALAGVLTLGLMACSRAPAKEIANKDSTDMKETVRASAAALTTMQALIHFANDQADLTDSARAILDVKLAIFRANPALRIVIVGYASQPGTAALVGGNRRCSGQLPQQLMISIRPFRLRWEPWS